MSKIAIPPNVYTLSDTIYEFKINSIPSYVNKNLHIILINISHILYPVILTADSPYIPTLKNFKMSPQRPIQ